MNDPRESIFWCHACLDDKPIAEQSFDSRYCRGCCEFLLNEANMLSPGKRPAWIPRPQNDKELPRRLYQVSVEGSGNMSTLGSRKIKVDIIDAVTPKRTLGKRGPKQKDLPQEIIDQWASDGMGSKAIASKLNRELDIKVSYKTIQRLLSGEREKNLVTV
ncbi:hypothetical protein ACFLV5_02075 [Chloroflexota bacterium]